jgi:hypothetical protein
MGAKSMGELLHAPRVVGNEAVGADKAGSTSPRGLPGMGNLGVQV